MTKEIKEYWPITKLKPWDKNPRQISDEALDELIAQLKELKEYKPLLIEADGTILGGNQRFKAFQKMGVKDVWVHVVKPKDDEQRIKYMMSDNENKGYYIEDELQALLKSVQGDFKDYLVNLAPNTALDTFLKTQEKIDAAYDESMHEHDLSVYLEGAIKQIVLYFKPGEYEGVIEKFAGLMTDFGVESHTEAVIKLIEFYENNKPS